MLNRKEKNILKNTRKRPIHRNIKFSINSTINATLITATIALVLLYKDNINLPLTYRLFIGFSLTLFSYLFSSWHLFKNIHIANKLTIVYMKIKLKKTIPP